MATLDTLLQPDRERPAPSEGPQLLVWTEVEGAEVAIASFHGAHPDIPISVAPYMRAAHCVAEHIEELDFARALEGMARRGRQHIVVVTEPVAVPPGLLDRALGALDADLRLASVSFLSNDAGYLSFPERNRPAMHQVDDLDERSITQRLRTLGPEGPLAAVPVPAGSVVVLSKYALSACSRFRAYPAGGPGAEALTLAAWGLEAQQRGFLNAVDTNAYVSRLYDLLPPYADRLSGGPSRHWLFQSFPMFPAMYDDQRFAPESPVAIGHRLARVKVQGLRLGVDGTCLGPKEMGTQVQTLSLVAALCERSDVRRVVVALPGPVPAYARETLAHAKVDIALDRTAEFAGAGDLDLLHRPFQPDRPLPFEAWRKRFPRTVLTLQDVIAYQVGAYHADVDEWIRQRECVRYAAAQADGLVVISEDIRRQLAFEALPAEGDRTFVIPNGTDHLRGDEDVAAPVALARAGFVAGSFLLVLGANYAHKNRDLAIRAWRRLRSTSHPELALVLVGAYVPFGSSRLQETRALADGEDDVFVLADVTSAERNWLLRHASALLYPTSAEGFGLVPFEAARFDTPAIEVSFGPLAEVTPDLPNSAADWSPEALADATAAVLDDPALARASVDAVLESGAGHTWRRTAAGLVEAYRSVLARPPRGS